MSNYVSMNHIEMEIRKNGIEAVLSSSEDKEELGKALDEADAHDGGAPWIWQIDALIYLRAAKKWRGMLKAQKLWVGSFPAITFAIRHWRSLLASTLLLFLLYGLFS